MFTLLILTLKYKEMQNIKKNKRKLRDFFTEKNVMPWELGVHIYTVCSNSLVQVFGQDFLDTQYLDLEIKIKHEKLYT